MTIVVGTNTYISVADADLYFTTRYNSSFWISLDNATKEALLVSATRSLDLYCDWSGYKTDENQPLQFPRNNEEIPEAIKIAQCEISFSIYDSDSVIDSNESALKKMKADVVEFEWFESSTKTNTLYSNFTQALLKSFCSSMLNNQQTLIRV